MACLSYGLATDKFWNQSSHKLVRDLGPSLYRKGGVPEPSVIFFALDASAVDVNNFVQNKGTAS